MQDILTALAFVHQKHSGAIELVGLGKAAVWSEFAAAVAPIPVKLRGDASWFHGSDEEFLKNLEFPESSERGGIAARSTVRSALLGDWSEEQFQAELNFPGQIGLAGDHAELAGSQHLVGRAEDHLVEQIEGLGANLQARRVSTMWKFLNSEKSISCVPGARTLGSVRVRLPKVNGAGCENVETFRYPFSRAEIGPLSAGFWPLLLGRSVLLPELEVFCVVMESGKPA